MTDGLVLMVATDAFISAGTTSPRKRRHEARYWESGPRGSHLIMKLAGSKAAAVICGVVCCSWPVLPLEMTGAYACIMKWRRGYGTRFVWNSLRSTLRSPLRRREHVSELTSCTMMRFRLAYVGLSRSRLRLQMSYSASLSTMKETLVYSWAMRSRSRAVVPLPVPPPTPW